MKELIRVNEVEITKIEYKGRPVLTFKMIDAVHRRPEGTTSRTFTANKERFVEGKHFYLLDFTQNNVFRFFGIEIPPRGLTVLTEAGYLLLVKSFTDDLAWGVQEKLVEAYFALKEIKKIDTGEYKPVAHLLVDLLNVFSALKVPEHLAQIESIKQIELQTGTDLSFALKYAPSQNNIIDSDKMFEPKELGYRLHKISAQRANKLLEEIGLQKKDKNEEWIPTKTGETYCALHSWKRGTKTGYNYKWNLEKVKQMLIKRKSIK